MTNRLFPLALAIWLGAACTGLTEPPWNLLLLLALALSLSLLRVGAVVLAIALLVGGTGFALRTATLSHNALHRAVGEQMEIAGVVTSDPTWGRPSVSGARFRAPSLSFLVRVERARIDNRDIHLRVPARVISHNQVPLQLGDRFSGEVRVLSTHERKVAALLILATQPKKTANASRLLRMTTSLRHNFSQRTATIRGDSGALIPGLVLGDTSRQSPEFASEMRRTGFTHLTAVSGANFAIVAATVLWCSQWVFRRRRARLIVTALILFLFIVLVRPSPSVLRASVMTAVLLIAQIRGSRSHALSSLGLAISLLVLIDPFQALDPGFALSVAATAGILLLAPRIVMWLRSRGLSERSAELLAIPIAATALCTPVLIAISGQLSLISIPANILVAPAVAPITVVGFIAALIPHAGWAHLLLTGINPFAQWIVFIAHSASRFPVLLFPSLILGMAIVSLAALLLVQRKWISFLAVVSALGLVMHLQSTQWPGGNWVVANCDVGQGDALALNVGQHKAILIDTGPDPTLISNCLRSLHIREISLLVLTHFHADHVAGISGVLKIAKVNQVWISHSQEPNGEYLRTLSALGLRPIRVVHAGERFTLQSTSGPISIDVLWPNEQRTDFEDLPGDGSAINNSSIALNMAIDGVRIFAAGDIEPPAQSEIMRSGRVHEVDILKVAHHGSAYQDHELMKALHPRLAIISVGRGNSYGHPSPRTVRYLAEIGARVRRTDQDGAIASDSHLRIRTRQKAWWRISWG